MTEKQFVLIAIGCGIGVIFSLMAFAPLKYLLGQWELYWQLMPGLVGR